ncbi:MAG: glycosyltransferase family 4 protein [Anaerolineales bacterium]|jgi:glycosyltransferase involved in cell wall biosynthesis|nr:glycosyltransferase family 4 protein [Anaerolineales bacterium]
MKIVAISASQIPSNVANSIQAMKAVHALAELGHNVTLIVPNHEKHNSDWETLAHLYGLKTRFSIEYIAASSRRLFFLTAVRRARAFKPALLYVWPVQSSVLGLVHGFPVIMEIHDQPAGRIGPFWYRYFRDMRGKKRIAIITRALQAILDEQFGTFLAAKDVVLAPNGVELERFVDLPDPETARRSLNLPEAPTVACTGHLYAGRGMELFLKLARRMSDVRFLWAGGKPEDVEKWRQEAKDLPNVNFAGFVPNQQLPLYQAAADVLLMPYGNTIAISSGMGNSAKVSSPMKMFEYLATGRPILSSDLPVFREVLNENNAVFCPPDDSNAWQGALRGLLDNPDRRAALGAQARKDAENYSWTARAQRLLDGFI